MTNHTPRVRGGFKLNRTLVSFRHCLASLGNTKEKCSLLLWYGGGEIFLEKGKGVFISGFCLPSIQAGGGTMRTRFWQNYFEGWESVGHFRKTLSILYSKNEKCTASVKRGFAKTSAHLFFHLLLFLFWGNSGRTKNRKYKFNFNVVSVISLLVFRPRSKGDHPRHSPRTFPLGLLALRCLGLAHFLAVVCRVFGAFIRLVVF